MSSVPRLNRLFSYTGRCLSVGLDHTGFSQSHAHTTDVSHVVDGVVAAYPDAIHLNADHAPLLQTRAGKLNPALILRADVADLEGMPPACLTRSRLISRSVEQALALDAACMVVSLRMWPDQPDLLRQCIANVRRLKSACVTYGMPLMVEVMPIRPHQAQWGFVVDDDFSMLAWLVREAVTLEADIISTVPTVNIDDFHEVLEAAAGRPVIPQVRGSMADADLVTQAYAMMKQGAAGIVYDPRDVEAARSTRVVQALRAVVHENAKVRYVLPLLRPSAHAPYSGQVMS